MEKVTPRIVDQYVRTFSRKARAWQGRDDSGGEHECAAYDLIGASRQLVRMGVDVTNIWEMPMLSGALASTQAAVEELDTEEDQVLRREARDHYE